MKIRIAVLAAGLFFALALACGIAFNIIGSYVDEQGFLQEPFALIPLTGIFLVLSFLCAFGAFIGFLVRKWRFRQSSRH